MRTTLSLVTGIVCVLLSFTVAPDVSMQLDIGSINNILKQSQSSTSTTRIGSMSKSELKSVDIMVNVDESNNIVENAINSSARTNIGTITNVTGNKATIEVDVKQVDTKILGGNNNHAITNIGALQDVDILGTVSIKVRAGKVNNTIAGGTGNNAEVSIGYDPNGDSDSGDNTSTSSNSNNQHLNSPYKPYTSLIQTVAATNTSSTNKSRTAFPKVTKKHYYHVVLPNGQMYWKVPMFYNNQKPHCLDVNRLDTCLQEGGIPMTLIIHERWVDGKTVESSISPWTNDRKKFKLTVWNSWKKTAQGIAITEAKNSFNQYWKYCCAKSKKIYRVKRQFERVYTANPKSPDYAYYAAYAKRMNKIEKNSKREKYYDYTKTTRGKGATKTIIDPYYFKF